MTVDRFPIWGFGLLGILIGCLCYTAGITTIESASFIAVWFGLPTWFIGLLKVGLTADKYLTEYPYSQTPSN